MNKLLAALLVAFSCTAQAENYLQYKYNDAVTIVISNAECPFLQMQKEYKFTAAAFRIDGNKIAGCYKKYNEDLIEIQWYKGDKTVLPANAFLQPNSVVPDKKVETTL